MATLLRVPEALRDSVARTRVDYRRLGTSGLRVSSPILGGLHMGSSLWAPWVLNEEQVRGTFCITMLGYSGVEGIGLTFS
jgi:hypothetical protein